MEGSRKFVVGDTEQHTSMVFSWTGVPVVTDNSKFKIGKPFTLINHEAMLIDNMNTDLERKIKDTLFDVIKNGERHRVCTTTREFLMEMGKFIHQNGGVLVHHSIDRDLMFLYMTDKQFGQKFFTHNPLVYKDMCTKSKCWTGMTWICSQRLLDQRCYYYCSAFRKSGCTTSRLSAHLAFVFGPDYVQKHLSPDDAKDLTKLLEYAFDTDEFFIGDSDFMIAH
jgi:hypothetical protein